MTVDYSSLPMVVKVVDDYRIVINRGSENDVKTGAQYLIFGLDDEIVDPVTKESLGKLEVVRGRARVTHVQGRLATLDSSGFIELPGTKKTIRRQGGSITNLLNLPIVEEVEEGGEKERSRLFAKLGDLARPI